MNRPRLAGEFRCDLATAIGTADCRCARVSSLLDKFRLRNKYLTDNIMKNYCKITRCAVIALAAGAFCFANSAFAAEKKAEMKSDMKSEKSDMKSDMKGAGMELDSQDKEFVMEAAKGGMMEVEMGKMAGQQGKSADVKKIGKMMVTDHTKANNQLMAIAKKKGVMIDKKMEKMEKMSGDFDKEYLDSMVKDHDKDIAAFEKEAKDGKDADVKGFASKTLPTLKKHLQMVKDAQGKMSKTS